MVQNHIDFYEMFESNNPMLVLLWAIAALDGPCRSGGARFYINQQYCLINRAS